LLAIYIFDINLRAKARESKYNSYWLKIKGIIKSSRCWNRSTYNYTEK